MGEHPKPFPTLPSNSVVTFSATDFISGAGYVNIYPFTTETDKILQFSAINGKDIKVSCNSEANKIEFVSEFSTSQTVNGIAVLIGSTYFKNNYASSQTCSQTAYFNLVKRTSLGDTTLKVWSKFTDLGTIASGGTSYVTHYFSENIDNIRFNKGDSLVLECYLEMVSQQGSTDAGVTIDTEELSFGKTFLIMPFKVVI